jgi:hypothetical protein
LFELLTDERAFGAEHAVDTLHAVLPSPPALAKRIPS